jgi:hypothetical protein
MPNVEYLLIGPRKELERYKETFKRAGKKVAIFDPSRDSIKAGVELLRKTSGAVATFGFESVPFDKEFIETLAETRDRIPSIMVVQPYQFFSPTDLMNRIRGIKRSNKRP